MPKPNAILRAAREGDLATLDKLLPRASTADAHTALGLAAAHNHGDVVRRLLGASPDSFDLAAGLRHASEGGHTELAEELLLRLDKPLRKSPLDFALKSACSYDRAEVVAMLLSYHPTPLSAARNCLSTAAEVGRGALMDVVLSHAGGWSDDHLHALSSAVDVGNEATLRRLLQAHGPTQLSNSCALRLAVAQEQSALMLVLLPYCDLDEAWRTALNKEDHGLGAHTRSVVMEGLLPHVPLTSLLAVLDKVPDTMQAQVTARIVDLEYQALHEVLPAAPQPCRSRARL